MEAKEQRGGSEPMAAISYSTQFVMRVSLVSSLHHVYTVGWDHSCLTTLMWSGIILQKHNSLEPQFLIQKYLEGENTNCELFQEKTQHLTAETCSNCSLQVQML